VSGRGFTTAEDSQGNVAVVNEAFIRQFGGGDDPATMHIAFGFPRPPADQRIPVIGVVNDVKYASLGEGPEPAFYVAETQLPFVYSQSVVIDTRVADATSLIPAIRERVRAFDPYVAADIQTVAGVLAATVQRERLGMVLMLLFGLIAVTLSAVGIHGVTAYISALRRVDVATRLALGATPSHVFWTTIQSAATVAVPGTVIGLAMTVIAGGAAAPWLYQVRAADPVTLGASLIIVNVILLAATVLAARRESRVEPSLVLRGD
jgi:ABC-type antimicrobial peptide transport system permease subunit